MGLVFRLGSRTSFMTFKKFGLILIGSIVFILVLVAEYLFCSSEYRFIRIRDLLATNLISLFLAISLCYLFFRKLMKEALTEKIHLSLVLTFFWVLSFLLGCFFRLTFQIGNGLFDGSYPETKIVVVASRNSSIFGASIKDGLNAMAYYIDFPDWDNMEKSCELLIPYSIYFEVGSGTNMELSVKSGFFGLPWVEDYRVMDE
jgi:hypothetical protein